MQIGDKVWIFDSNSRVYKDDKGNETRSPWYRGYFREKVILGETKQSWLVGYERGRADDKSNLKVNKNTLTYSTQHGDLNGKLYVSEEEIDRECWLNENTNNLSVKVRDCKDYNKLREIEKILNEK